MGRTFEVFEPIAFGSETYTTNHGLLAPSPFPMDIHVHGADLTGLKV